MTTDEQAAALARCERATPGPWRVGDRPTGHKIILAPFQDGKNGTVAHVYCEYDAEFIAAARTDLPLALAEIARLTALTSEPWPATGDDSALRKSAECRAKLYALCVTAGTDMNDKFLSEAACETIARLTALVAENVESTP